MSEVHNTDKGAAVRTRRRYLKQWPLPPSLNLMEFAPRPVEIRECAAAAMVRKTLARQPDAAALPAAVEVMDAGWLHDVAYAWRKIALEFAETGSDPDGEACEQDHWFEYKRGLPGSSLGPSDGNGIVAHALRTGVPVVGYAPAPMQRHLPADLMRVASTVRIASLDGSGLADAVTAYFGCAPEGVPPDDLARSVSVDDLDLALRPDDNPDAYLDRLLGLVRAKRPAVAASVPLDRMHGMDEAVRWGMDLALDLGDYRSGSLTWADVDKGCLLTGPPGTGKTTWAGAVANWCGTPLIVGGLAKWQASRDGHLGHCLSAMRADFALARQSAPCLLFVDEVDGFGDRARSGSAHHDYHVQIVNSFLEQLDGTDGREGVVVIAACNDAGRLDPAIVRSGRLDRTIQVGLPNARALAAIFRHHLAGDLPGADLGDIADAAVGSTGADVQRWVRDARRAARRSSRTMTEADLKLEAIGERRRDPEAMRRIAFHEAGHAVVASLDRPGCVRSVTVRPSGNHAGHLTSDGFGPSMTQGEIRMSLRLLLAGRAAEQVLLGEVSSGAGGCAESDLALATTLAVSALGSMGMGDDLAWSACPRPADIGATLAMRPAFARKVSALLAEVHGEVVAAVGRHRFAVKGVADRLLAVGMLTGEEVERVLTNGRF